MDGAAMDGVAASGAAAIGGVTDDTAIGVGFGARAEAGRVVIVVLGSMSFVAIVCGRCGAAVASACGCCGAGGGGATAIAGIGSLVVSSAIALAPSPSSSVASSSLDGASGTVVAVISKRGVGPVGRDGLGGAAVPRTIGVGICVSFFRGAGTWAVGASASQAASVSRDLVDVSSVGVQAVSSTTIASVTSGLASTAIPVNGVATIVGGVS